MAAFGEKGAAAGGAGAGAAGGAGAPGVGAMPAAASQRPAPDAAQAAIEDEVNREFIRAENEDDDGYDPYSDRRPVREPLFERDPWA